MDFAILNIVLLVAYAGGILSLCVALVQTLRMLRVQGSPRLERVQMASWPTLDIVVPVKDEEGHIRKCLESILAQDYPHKRIIVVNDRSTDGTAAQVEVMRAGHPEIQLVNISALPDGLYGKPHAVHEVRGLLTSEYVAFVDSDLHLAPACMKSLVHHLSSNAADWVAVMGKPQIFKFWERLLVPLLGAVTFAWYDPRKVSDPKWPDAVGSALMVARRSSYEAIGGHGCVIRTYDEDSELVRIAKRAGQKVSFLMTPDLFTQRHYGTLTATIRGITRTFIGGIKTIPRLLVTINALQFVSLLPLGVLVLFPALGQAGIDVPLREYWMGAAAFHLFVSTALALVIYRTADTHGKYALLHPLGSAMLIWVCIRAAIRLHRKDPITWRGTSY
ncbi:MAG: hypothetical protein DCC65_08110 [Planctomycetota bacterium]|nr:MAG: hypothetical protein DCC65_08110 [Planctomycetota bacterium]